MKTHDLLSATYMLDTLLRFGPSDNDGRCLIGDTARVFPLDESVVAPLSPPNSPRVFDDPVLDSFLDTVPHDQNRMIDVRLLRAILRSAKRWSGEQEKATRR